MIFNVSVLRMTRKTVIVYRIFNVRVKLFQKLDSMIAARETAACQESMSGNTLEMCSVVCFFPNKSHSQASSIWCFALLLRKNRVNSSV